MAQCPNLGEAVARFLGSLPEAEREKAQQEVYRFARWCGLPRALQELTPPDIARYGEQVCSLSSEPAKALEPVKAFLSYLYKAGLTETSFSPHIRVRKTASAKTQAVRPAAGPEDMTADGYTALQEELRALQEERPHVVEEITRAAADKDFRENAPLQAAKERQGYLEGRIQEIEATLKSAKVVVGSNGTSIEVGSTVVLNESDSGDELCLTLVHPSEANPGCGKVSLASPIGKALVGRRAGEVVAVAAPAGTLHYRVVEVRAQR